MRWSLTSSALVLGALAAPACFAQTTERGPRPGAGEAAAPLRVAQPAPPAAANAAPPAGAEPTAPNAVNGAEVFASTCVICHGEDGQGGHGGGAPLAGITSQAAAVQTIAAGRNNMPAFDGLLTHEQIRDVAAYVVERLSEKAR